jgi:hypothetical protein
MTQSPGTRTGKFKVYKIISEGYNSPQTLTSLIVGAGVDIPLITTGGK